MKGGVLSQASLIPAPVTAALTSHLILGWPLPLTLSKSKVAEVAAG